MRIFQFASLAVSGIRAMVRHNQPPVLATIILTDKCNLNCRGQCVVYENRTCLYLRPVQ